MPNYYLIAFDLCIFPVTIFRMMLIYLFGSRYDISGFEFLDVMNHAKHPYFNQLDDNMDYESNFETNDLRYVINRSSLIDVKNDKSDKSIVGVGSGEDKNNDVVVINDKHESNKKMENLLDLLLDDENNNINVDIDDVNVNVNVDDIDDIDDVVDISNRRKNEFVKNILTEDVNRIINELND